MLHTGSPHTYPYVRRGPQFGNAPPRYMPSLADSSGRSDSVRKTAFSSRGRCRPLQWPAGSWTARTVVGVAALIGAGELQLFEWVGDLMQMLRGQVKIPGRSLQILMTEQQLNGAQVGTGFQQMRRPAVPNQMGTHLLIQVLFQDETNYAILSSWQDHE